MKTIIFSSMFLLLMAATVFAQQKTTNKSWRFHSLNSVGLLEGQAGSAFQLQSVNGAQYKSWFAGIGLGLDYYRYRTIPLFVDLKKEFGKSAGKVFVYADLGINFAWVTEAQKRPYYTDDHFGNGLYTDLGLGYNLAMKKNNALLISVGYSNKRLTETYPGYIYLDPYIDFTSISQTQKINYSLNRLSIRIGWQF